MKKFVLGAIIVSSLTFSSQVFANTKQIPAEFIGCWDHPTNYELRLEVNKNSFNVYGIEVATTHKIVSLNAKKGSFTAQTKFVREEAFGGVEKGTSKETMKLVNKNTLRFYGEEFVKSKCQ